MNALQMARKGDMPYHLKAGFFIFLESERLRHLDDVTKIEKMMEEIIWLTPSLTEEIQAGFKEYAQKFVDFSLKDEDKK